jgi:prostaglandin reductase 1
MVVGKKFVLKRPFDGMPKIDDFELIEEHLPPLKDGEILIEAMFLSVDPYMRMYVLKMSPPFTMIGIGVYKVCESQDSNYPKGATVIANVGWVKTGLITYEIVID